MIAVEACEYELVPYRGFTLINGIHDPDDVDQIQDLEIRDSDVFVVTYPKSGTSWMQQILLLLEAKGDLADISRLSSSSNADRMPWIEMRVSHLLHQFMPSALSQKKGKVIYVTRNPKDILVSYFYFHKLAKMLETPKDFDDFFEKFMRGDVFGCSWFEHVKTWYSHKDDMNMLFITYEEMIQDLPSAVQRIAVFLEKELNPEQLANVVKHRYLQQHEEDL
ncbi:hypothetical protein KUCAC02_014620 [Chaenocephalus aceratus]|uniref:Uncharacterized protein n=1 Tax=Chaenocephalus aceratus TaxID=36190 RepID=A0ACB9WEZ8_CHAAC|nr:hypothetical protein KUCAC02_014620 [Chaenocephalus aceratus]